MNPGRIMKNKMKLQIKHKIFEEKFELITSTLVVEFAVK